MMTTKEMLAIVDKMHDQPCPYGIGGTAWIALRDCVEKLSPKVPKRSDSGAYHICPNKDCRRLIERREQAHGNIDIPYCKWCGQALKWEEEL